eukprot:6290459-Alexandrium_andersonii.AAC.1
MYSFVLRNILRLSDTPYNTRACASRRAGARGKTPGAQRAAGCLRLRCVCTPAGAFGPSLNQRPWEIPLFLDSDR